jgi:ATP-dependent helicase/nuclease subunit A
LEWSSDQKKVIDLRNKNILVSAAAGSGKTAVLVQRIINIITDKDKKIDIDRLLIVTFTNAAAAEMRERIGLAIEKRLQEDPEDLYLQKQQTLIHNAQITTIHSFCLNVIRNNFNTIELDPAFRIADETELKLLKSDSIAQVLERNYEQASDGFIEFIESYSSGKTDLAIEDILLSLYNFSQSYPDPQYWLNALRVDFEVSSVQDLEDKPYIQFLVDYIHQVVADTLDTIDQAIELCGQADGPYMYLDAFTQDKALVRSLTIDSYNELSQKLYEVKWARLSSKKDEKVSTEKRDLAKVLRDDVKTSIDTIRKSYFFQSTEEMVADIIGAKRVMNVLINLVLEFSKEYSEAKASKNILDFNDLEHKALSILVKKDNGKYVKTAVATDLSNFYEQILIDEYQDSNLVQETLLNSISREEFSQPNVFMVGDVKQSIYKFRLARPELFMEKYNAYATQQDENYDKDCKYERIDLHKNFRSRKEVLACINFIFEQVMDSKLGGIDYNDQAALYPAAVFPETDENAGGATELLLVDLSQDMLEDEEMDYTSKELEAKAIANRIKQIVSPEGLKVYDKNTSTYRSAKYKDIVILLRTVSGWADTFEAVLMTEGIAAHCDSSMGYFSTLEIQTILSVLNIVDNPIQDIALTAVLKSPIGGFSSEQLAIIKSEFNKSNMYVAITNYIEAGSELEIRAKLSQFMTMLNGFRDRVPYTSIHELIWIILDTTDYYNYISAMPAGAKRRANVEMLIDKAIAFEQTSYKGLFNFIRYIEKIREFEIDFGEASTLSENEDVVRIMSIHKSKGLEFPVVFAAGLSKSFNNQDSRSKMVIHSDLGIGPDYIDHRLRVKSPTLIKKIISKKIVLENLAEELRVLYVALTRAKEKLILTGTIKKMDKSIEKLNYVVKNVSTQKLPFTFLASATCYLDWVLAALARHSSFSELLNTYGIYAREFELKHKDCASFENKCITLAQLVEQEVGFQVTKQNSKQELLKWNTQIFDQQLHADIQKRLNFVYPHQKEVNLYSKMTVTQLKVLGQHVDEDYSYHVPINQENSIMPKFLSNTVQISGANRGTVLHKVMQNIDFAQINSLEALSNQIEQLVQRGKLKEHEKEMIDVNAIYQFILSPLAQRMNSAQKAGKLFREKQFVIGIPANEINTDFKSDEIVLIQGIIDVYFEQEQGIIVVDYKTDKVEVAMEQTLIHRYSQQLAYYSRAIEQITGKKVLQKIIYSFSLCKEIYL